MACSKPGSVCARVHPMPARVLCSFSHFDKTSHHSEQKACNYSQVPHPLLRRWISRQWRTAETVRSIAAQHFFSRYSGTSKRSKLVAISSRCRSIRLSLIDLDSPLSIALFISSHNWLHRISLSLTPSSWTHPTRSCAADHDLAALASLPARRANMPELPSCLYASHCIS